MTSRTIHDLPEWDTFIQELLPDIQPGTILALSGPLGAGKTTFVQAFARALGVKDRPASPTFSLVRTYKTKHPSLKTLVHVDAYRIEDQREVMALGLEDALAEPGTVLCLEWPEKIQTWMTRHASIVMHVRIDPLSDSSRIVSLHR